MLDSLKASVITLIKPPVISSGETPTTNVFTSWDGIKLLALKNDAMRIFFLRD
ncbi:hypothetical protein A2U01_0068167 [Trifolium medium]|uniref:Uncharacterized protein n=1 Tax=Trifolium medium TaxID=97028 RepID=A0A392SGE1_9FABA|nr:hypothetical protein [Trifolium medium]